MEESICGCTFLAILKVLVSEANSGLWLGIGMGKGWELLAFHERTGGRLMMEMLIRNV